MSQEADGRRYLIGGGVAACAACCAPPVLALFGIVGAGAVATVATLVFAGLAFAVVVAALTFVAFMGRRRRAHLRSPLPARPPSAEPRT